MPSWTYDYNPAGSPLSEIRFLIADTDQKKPWTLYDPEINAMVGLYSANPPVVGQNMFAAAVCAEAILAKLKSMLGSKGVGDLRVSQNPDTVKFYEATAYRLRQRANLQAVVPYTGGTSQADKNAQNADTDRIEPAFQVDGMSNVLPLNQVDPTQGI